MFLKPLSHCMYILFRLNAINLAITFVLSIYLVLFDAMGKTINSNLIILFKISAIIYLILAFIDLQLSYFFKNLNQQVQHIDLVKIYSERIRLTKMTIIIIAGNMILIVLMLNM